MNTRTVPIEARVYAVVDAVHDTHTVMANDENDEVWIEALNAKGEYVTFEAEAYHLELWCQENGLILYEGIIETDVDLEEVEPQ